MPGTIVKNKPLRQLDAELLSDSYASWGSVEVPQLGASLLQSRVTDRRPVYDRFLEERTACLVHLVLLPLPVGSLLRERQNLRAL